MSEETSKTKKEGVFLSFFGKKFESINAYFRRLSQKEEKGKVNYTIIEYDSLKLLKFRKPRSIVAFIVPALLTIAIFVFRYMKQNNGGLPKVGEMWFEITIAILIGLIGMILEFLFVDVRNFKKTHDKTKGEIDFHSIYKTTLGLLEHCKDLQQLRKWPTFPEETANNIKAMIEQARELSEHPYPSPNFEERYIEQFKAEKGSNNSSIISVWASTPAVWQNPTAIYYLTMNGLVNLKEHLSLKENKQLDFSRDIVSFSNEEENILNNNLSNQGFFSARFLIFSGNEYKTYETHIKTLIQLLHYFRIHCFPIVEDELISSLNENESEKDTLKEFNEKFKSEGENTPFLPDFTLIKGYKEWQPPGVDEFKSALWVVKNGDVKDGDSEDVENAEKVIKVLASHYLNYDKVKWSGYIMKEVLV
jgi:hypothetical protein